MVIDTQVTIEEGSSLADDAVTAELGLSDDTAIENSAPAVTISASGAEQAENPFSLALPLPTTSGLWLFSSPWDNLAVIYKVKNAETGKIYKGIFTLASLSINQEDGTVNVTTKFFGSYQAVIFNKPVTTEVQKEDDTPILAKSAESTLPTVALTAVVAELDAASRRMSAKATGDNTDKITSCYTFLDQDKVSPFDYREAASGGLSHAFNVAATQSGNFYVRFTCRDSYGRTINSPWSDPVDVPDSMSVSTLSKVFSMAVATAQDVPSCSADNEGQLVYIEADNLFRVCKSTGWANINVRGPQGAVGPTGPAGPAGSDANVMNWYWVDVNGATVGEVTPLPDKIIRKGNDEKWYLLHMNSDGTVGPITTSITLFFSTNNCNFGSGVAAIQDDGYFQVSSINGIETVYADYSNTIFYIR